MRRLVPVLREEELLYGAIARGRRYLQAPEAGPFMRELRGRRCAVASVDLPGQLDALVRDLPEGGRQAAVDDLIDRATMLPFHVAFMPEEVRAEARATMRGDVAGLHARLGLSAFRVRAPERLRFCPTCLDGMERERTDLWWRRDHQLPGVPVCPVHGTVLRLSDVAPGDANRHSFVAATRAVCRADAPAAIEGAAADDLARLADLARCAAALLVSPPPARGYDEIMAGYRSRLADAGLMRSRRKVDHAALHAAFRERWGGVTELIPSMALVDDPERSWLSALVRNGRRAAHPLQHLMLTAMLDGMAGAERDEPFGPGPWPCRNPVAAHHGRDVIGDVELRRDRGVVYGDFACSCGYFYSRSRSRSADGVIGEPRYRRFGPLLVPALKAALACGDGLRATARALGLDPATLMREAAMAGVAVPWTTGASGAVPVTRARVDEAARPARRKRQRRRLRNWFAIDARLAKSARAAAAAIAAETPPSRITFAEMERRVAQRDWIQKRRAKLPRTVEAMEMMVETTDAFRGRRLAWCVAQADEAGDLRPCEILRVAGLPMAWLPAVRDAIAKAMLPRRVAA